MSPDAFVHAMLTAAVESQYGLAVQLGSRKQVLAFQRRAYKILREADAASPYKCLSLSASRTDIHEIWILKNKSRWLTKISRSGIIDNQDEE